MGKGPNPSLLAPREAWLGLCPHISLQLQPWQVEASISKKTRGEYLYTQMISSLIHWTALAGLHGRLGHNPDFYSEVCSIRDKNMAQLLESQ